MSIREHYEARITVFAKRENRISERGPASRAVHGGNGFSLLEVLIAGTVFSVGLAGLAALLLASIVGSAEARREGIAAVAAASLAEHIRLNPAGLDHFLAPPERLSRVCAISSHCTAGQQADYDFALWQLELADAIPGARGVVCRDSSPEDGLADNFQCDGDGPVVIKVFWSGTGSTINPGTKQYRFSMEAG